jgi:hypothetical protein
VVGSKDRLNIMVRPNRRSAETASMPASTAPQSGRRAPAHLRTHEFDAYDGRIRALHDLGHCSLQISVMMRDVMVAFIRPTEGFVRARLQAMGLLPNRNQPGRPRARASAR